MGPVALLLLTAAAPALAHAPDARGAHDALLHWTFEPWVVVPLLIAAALYARGIRHLWRNAGRGRGITLAQVACFAAGWLSLVAALVSPLDTLGGRLFSAHMVQHEVLMLVSAPLIVLARPLAAWTWAFSLHNRQRIGDGLRPRWWRATWSFLTEPVAATALHALALWLWHVPASFEAALHSEAVHALQHTSFLGTALFFWWAVLGRDSRVSRGGGMALACLFATMMHTSALGALLTLAPTPWYPAYAASAPLFGMDPVEDQQLGGLVMWVPGAAAYLWATLAIASRFLGFRGATQPRAARP
ncbi:cytochrome c oxidase assembly protein [Ramlibacter sp. PS4R-6]|uniref:cytochrome c oxidase assembly protein n=1 Tax=Ramlibacter sp. PS4R-6 TaxID=3133438 RepID=UPI0030AF9BDD